MTGNDLQTNRRTALAMLETAVRATGSAEESMTLLTELGLSWRQASVGVGVNEWFVTIYKMQKRPAITRWLGWPVRYHIGGGTPRPYLAADHPGRGKST